jgi:prolyl oligopeptidase
MTKPPLADPEFVTESVHGVTVVDPYRWLEDKESPRTRAWIERQNTYCRSYYATLPGRGVITDRIQELASFPTIETPLRVGGRYFFLKREASQEQPCICIRDTVDSPDTVLIDPSPRGKFVSVNIVDISADGSLLAYGVRDGGEDAQAVEILDIASNRLLPDRLPKGFLRGLHFIRNEGYVYSHEPVHSARPNYRAAFMHYLDSKIAVGPNQCPSDEEVFTAEESPKVRLITYASPDSKWIAFLVMRSGARNITYSLFLQNWHAIGRPQTLLIDDFPHSVDLRITADQLFICTDWCAPNRRILSVPLNNPSFENFTIIVPETGYRIQEWAVSSGKLFVNYIDDLATRTRVFDFSGEPLGDVEYTAPGTSRLSRLSRQSDAQFFTFQSFSQPPRVFEYPGQPFSLASTLKLPDLEVRRVRFESADGTRIPLCIVSKRGLGQAQAPAILTGYGGSAISITPHFSQLATFFLEHNCRFIIATLRGGSEFGEAWHKAAQRHNRQKAFDDFIFAARWLTASGLTSPERLGIIGGSNSGLLVCAAVTQHPELFGAAIAIGPLTDMIRYHQFGFAHFWASEYGMAEDRDDFASLYAYSPYHRIQEGERYPAFLMISGDSDTRCDSLHARKFLARLQAASTSNHPILLDYSAVRGHTPSLPLTFRVGALVDRVAFLCAELGIIL